MCVRACVCGFVRVDTVFVCVSPYVRKRACVCTCESESSATNIEWFFASVGETLLQRKGVCSCFFCRFNVKKLKLEANESHECDANNQICCPKENFCSSLEVKDSEVVTFVTFVRICRKSGLEREKTFYGNNKRIKEVRKDIFFHHCRAKSPKLSAA